MNETQHAPPIRKVKTEHAMPPFDRTQQNAHARIGNMPTMPMNTRVASGTCRKKSIMQSFSSQYFQSNGQVFDLDALLEGLELG